MNRSGITLSARKIAVVVANDPIPSVSKKLDTAPMPTWMPLGPPTSVAGEVSVRGARRMPTTTADQPTANTAESTTSAARSARIGFSPMRICLSQALQRGSGQQVAGGLFRMITQDDAGKVDVVRGSGAESLLKLRVRDEHGLLERFGER